MGSISNCCCTPPCSTCDESLSPALSSLEFSSPDGLHPISFSADLRGAKPVIPGNVASYSNVQNTYATNPAFPMNANNASCRFPGEGLSWINDSDTTDNLAEALDASCCWAGLAVPEDVAVSTGKQHHYSESNQLDLIEDIYYTLNNPCESGTIHISKTTNSHTHEQGSSVFAKRFVFGVSIRACWRLGPYGTPILRLAAKVFYKDYNNVITHYYYKHNRIVTSYDRTVQVVYPIGYECVFVPGGTSETLQCEIYTPGIPADSTVPDPTQCLDCDPATNVNLTNQPRLFPQNCVMEFIERSIDIPTDTACSLIGTHVFTSSSPTTIKYAGFYNCCYTGVEVCRWKYPVQHPYTPPCDACSLPADYNVLLPGGIVRRIGTKVFTPGTLRIAGDDRVVMNWWTEPWTITIS